MIVKLKEVAMINFNHDSQGYVEATFRALTDALLPNVTYHDSSFHVEESDLGVHNYMIYSLDHYVTIQKQLKQLTIPLSYPTALLLDAAATQLVVRGELQPSTKPQFPNGGMFSHLSKLDRLKTLTALENIELDLYLLPAPFQNNAGLIKFITDALNRFALLGFYSEWSAYGTTRLYPPQERRLEYFPISWEEVGYPGVALGYRDFRGFLITMVEVRGRNDKKV